MSVVEGTLMYIVFAELLLSVPSTSLLVPRSFGRDDETISFFEQDGRLTGLTNEGVQT